jgi:hypothetical protein
MDSQRSRFVLVLVLVISARFLGARAHKASASHTVVEGKGSSRARYWLPVRGEHRENSTRFTDVPGVEGRLYDADQGAKENLRLAKARCAPCYCDPFRAGTLR